MKLPFVFDRKRSLSKPREDLQGHPGAAAAAGDLCSEEQSVRGLSDLYSPQQPGESHVYDIADVLLDMEKITPQQHARIRQQQQLNPGSDAAVLLLKAGLINADDILKAKARLYSLEFQHIDPQSVQKQAFEKLDIDFIKSNSICPIAVEEETLIVATSDPANLFAIEEVKRRTQMEVRAVVCSQEDIDTVCNSFKEELKMDYNVDDLISDMTDVEVVHDHQEVSEDLEKMAGQSPVIKFVNYLISNAIHEGASDIHIEPKEKFMRTRYRIDGVL